MNGVRLLYRILPMRWNSARLCSRRVTASSNALVSAPARLDFALPFFDESPSDDGLVHANCSAMIALRMSPFEDSTMRSSMSFEGCAARPPDAGFAKWAASRVCRARFMSVGAMGLNLSAR